jgi:DNA primase
VFCFDGDRAGREAGWRALERTLPTLRDGREVKFLFLPEGEDPDTLVRQEGREVFERRLRKALPLSRYLLDQLASKTDLSSVDGRARLVELARPHVAKLPAGAFRKLLAGQVAKLAGMPTDDVEALYFGEIQPTRGKSTRKPPKATRGGLTLARRALHLLLEYPQLAQSVGSIERLHQLDAEGAQMLAEIIEFLQHNPSLHAGALLEHWNDHEDQPLLVELTRTGLPVTEAGAKTEFMDALQRLTSVKPDQQRARVLLRKQASGVLSTEEATELAALLSARQSGKTTE